jgi:hypothetical protein
MLGAMRKTLSGVARKTRDLPMVNATRYHLGLVQAGLENVMNSPRKIRRFLNISVQEPLYYTSQQQLAPFLRYEATLRRRFGVVFRMMAISDGMKLSPHHLSRFDVVGLKFGFQWPQSKAEQVAASFRERLEGTRTKLVYFDGDDDVCIQWPGVISLVDLYVKKHTFADLSHYLREFIGKSNLTDYVARNHGISFDSDIIPRSGVLRPADLDKIFLGWNIGMDDKIIKLFERTRVPTASEKDNDIICRATVPSENWLSVIRNPVTDALKPIEDQFRVLLPTQRVSLEQYYQEMRRSRICVSPFGFGETCWRDFEAVLCGCLLVKPDMSHLRTFPDIYIPGETYVPVRWDFADLVDKCSYYLSNEPERARIAARAYEVLADHYRENRFLESFAGLLDQLKLSPPNRHVIQA